MSNFDPMIEPPPAAHGPVAADAVLPKSIESPAVARARRPLSFSRKLRGLMGGVALMGFTLLMVWIVIFDGVTPGFPNEFRGYAPDSDDEVEDSAPLRTPAIEIRRRSDAEPTERLSVVRAVVVGICALLMVSALLLPFEKVPVPTGAQGGRPSRNA